MKPETKLLLAALVATAAGALTMTPAHADGHHTEQLNAQFAPSTLTRAEVRAELLAAQRAGTLIRSERDAARARDESFKSVRTRAEVAAEAREANRLGLLAPRWTHLDEGFQSRTATKLAAN